MFALMLVTVAVLFIFLYISIIYLPLFLLLDEDTSIRIAREKIKFISKVIIRSLDVKVEVIYKDRKAIDDLDKKKGIIFVANHQSNIDIPVILTGLDIDVGFVAKEEMKSWPFFSTWMKKSKCVFINRENPREGIKSIKESVKVAKSGYPIVIFPEGERTLDGNMIDFKKGSFKLATETNGVIVPLTVIGSFEIQKRGELKMKRHCKVKLIVDEPIEMSALSKDEIKNLSKEVQEIIKGNIIKNARN